MWNTFVYDDEVYLLKINQLTSYNVILSNFINIWTENLSTINIVNRCKTLNPLITTNDEIYIKTVLSITDDVLSENNLILSKNEDEVKLEYKTLVASTQFKFSFDLKLATNSSLCKEITIPAIQTIQFLEKRQKELCELLKKKDEEIQQHVFENGNIKRESVKTEKFNQNEFDETTSKNLCCNVFSKSDEFNKTLIAKYGCLEPKLLTVKKEENRIKNNIPIANQILKRKRRNVPSAVKIKHKFDN